MEKNKKINRKNERGAITLFVLIACLFFALVLTGVYVATLNKMQTQEQRVDQIQENYARQLENIDEIYNELSGNVKLQLTQDPKDGTWTKEVTLIGNAEVKEGETVRIKEFAFGKENESISSLEWKEATNGQKITETTKVTENGIYYFWVEDSDGEIYQSNPVEVTNIDKIAPTPGSIIAKEENAEGEEYDLEKSPWTDKNVYIEKIDGTDGESGHAETTYTVKKDGITIHENIQKPVILEESGIYEITVTTKDNAGNEETSEPYIVKIDKVVPILSLKHNNVNGADYDGTWTKDDLYGEINLDSPSTGKSVEKYQYSYNGVVWNDISSEIVPTSIDYTTAFPLSEDKPDWFNGPVNNGDYYFEVQEDGTLKPTNGGSTGSTNKNTVANSYFEIDLTDYSEAELQITINATISSESSWDFGYAEITENTTAPTFNKNNTYYIKVSGSTKTEEYATTLTGGKKYYLHIGYSKDSSNSSNQDTFIINSIRLQSEELLKTINFAEYNKEGNKVTFKLQEDVEKEIYIRGVYTDGTTSKYGNATTIKIDKKAPIIESANPVILSRTEAKADVKVQENASGIKGYYISTDDIEPTGESNWVEQSLKEFSIEGLNTDTTYYLWVIDNVGNISEKKEIVIGKTNYKIDTDKYAETLEDAINIASDGSTIELLNDYTDTSIATFNKNTTFDIKGYTLTRTQTITINSEKEVEITGTGKITSEANNVRTITNTGTLTISNSITIENMSTSINYAPIYTNNSNSITNINDNVQIIGNYRGIYNSVGTVNVNGGKVEATYQGNSGYGIYNSSSNSKTYINDGEIKGYYGTYNGSSSTLEIIGGKIIGTGAYGISASGTTNVYGGRIEGKTYGVYSKNTDKVTIGREEDELSTTTPAIYGANYGIYMNNETYNLNFYNGVIISNTRDTAYRGVLNPRIGHMPYTYIDYEVEQKYCTILTPTVRNIEMKAEPTEYTNQNVTVTITYPYIQGITREYSEDGTEWMQTEEYIQEIIVEKNKTIYARTINESGVITEEKQIEVTNIDKEKPVVEVTPSQTKYLVVETNETIDLNITIKARDTGVSGLDKVQYAWVEEGNTLSYIDFTNEITINKENLKIGIYYLYINVTDKAGNKADIEQIRYSVEYEEPVCQIGNTKYLTIQEAVETCSKTAGENQTTIIMLKSTDEEFSTYEGQNIVLDLKGYTIGSSNPNTPICTNNGTLQIVDTSTEKTGKLESLNGTAIENNGTLTIGDNSTEIEMELPTIYGKQIGIKNEGTFNFYDGKIQGTAPIQGNVTNTPNQYGPVSTNYENGITTIQLGIVSGYEARIEWVYYTTVQGAVNATKTNVSDENRDIVTIIKDIQLKEILEISVAKNMILDLSGYAITITEKDRVINNNGKLEIMDSSIEKIGNILINSNTGCYGIYNNTGDVTVKEGIISSNVSNCNGHSYSCGIYNYKGSIRIEGGTINGNANTSNSRTDVADSYGIYNSSGKIEIIGGTISSNNNTSNTYLKIGYGIYNDSGKIDIIEGTVSSEGNCYGVNGIVNDNGDITIKGGTISSSNINSGSTSPYSRGITNSGSVIIDAGTVNSSGDSYNYGIYNYGKGNVIVENGTVNSSGINSSIYGIFNSSTGNVTIRGGVVSSSNERADSYGIYNEDTGNITISDGIVSSASGSENDSNSYGIYNISSENAIVEGGKISSNSSNGNSYGIYNINGILIIGNKEKEISQNNPIIQAEYIETLNSYYGYGIYNQLGNVEINNGLIQGKTVALLGGVTKIRDGYKIENSIIEEKDSIYLVEKINEEYIVQIDEIQYTSLQKAIDSIGENEEKTIEILKDFELNENINFNKNITLNLKGFTITNQYYRIENNNNLKIIDNTENQQGKIENISTIIGILNNSNGNIKIEGGIINSSGNIGKDSYGIYNLSSGSITITEGMVNSNDNNSYGIYNVSSGNITIEGGIISSSSDSGYASYGLYNVGGGNITVEGGIVSSSSSGGSYGESYGIYNASNGNVIVKVGTVSSSNSNSSSAVGYCYGIYNYSSGNVIVEGGEISSSSNNYHAHGIYNYGKGNVIIEDGIVNSSVSSEYGYSYGIYNNSSGTIEITGGTVNSESSSKSRNSYGIYNNSTGNITIGIKGDGTVSQKEPYIKGEYGGTWDSYYGYGVYNTKGTLYYYDGTIEGSTKSVYDIITEREENTQLNYNEDETILTLSTIITDVAQIGNITYPTLQEAIESVSNEQTTIKILRNITYTSQDIEIVIPNNKDIIIDLNRYKITSSIPNQVIRNEGILEIIDTSEEQTGMIITTENTTIRNIEGAKLAISGGIIENRKTQSIYNEGEVIISGGTVSSKESDEGYGIFNANNGRVIVKGGMVSSSHSNTNTWNNNSYGIYNSNGNIIVEGGIVSSDNRYNESYGIYNASSGTVEIIGGTVSSGGSSGNYGIYNNESGTVKVTGGMISSNYGIYNRSSGCIVIGIKKDGILLQEEPYIKGKINNLNGNLYYYDGKIEGSTKAINGNITEIEERTELLVTKGTSEIIQLEQKEANVARVNGVEYESIQKAVIACGETESTIEILRDSEPGATIIIGENQNITIDLKGYTINNYTELQNKGTLKIIDTSSEQLGKIVGLTGIVISNMGTITLESGGIADSGYGIKNTGILNITGGNITNNTYGVYNDKSGTTTIAGGNINSNTYGIYNYASSSTINVVGGNITANQYGIYNSSGTTNISALGITNNDYGIYNAGGTTNIKDGAEVQSNIGIYNSNGTVNIGEQGSMNSDSPIITGETYGLVNSPTGIVYMYDGQIRGKEGATQGYVTYTESGYAVANKTEGEYSIDYLVLAGTVETVAEVNGIAFSNLQSAVNSVIGEEAQTVKLTNGVILNSTLHISEGQNIILDMNEKTISSDLEVTIQNEGNLTIIDSTSSGVGKISSTGGVAIENSGTLTLGQDDGTVSQELITVEGETYGIVNSGTFNFYDGTINGASAIQGVITNRPEGYVIRITTVNGKERYYLSL